MSEHCMEAPDSVSFDEIEIPGVPSVFDSVAVVSVKPGDVILFRSPDSLTAEQTARIGALLESLFPGHESLILTHGTDLAVLRPAGE